MDEIRCYICNRTQKDLDVLREKKIEEFKKILQNHEIYKDKKDELIQLTQYKNELEASKTILKLQIKTVFENQIVFQEEIPSLEKILNSYTMINNNFEMIKILEEINRRINHLNNLDSEYSELN